MRVAREDSDISLEFHVTCNDKHCDEYVLLGRPISNNDEHTVKECFVPVSSDAHITINGILSGTLRMARFDLLIDGSWAGDHTVEPLKTGGLKQHSKRKIDFVKAQSIVEDADTICAHDGVKVFNGELITTELPPHLDTSAFKNDAVTYGVGSIVVIASIDEDYAGGHAPNPDDYPDRTIGGWVGRKKDVRDSGIVPTHSIELKRQSAAKIMGLSMKPLQKLKERKFGWSPFARFVFNYRSLSSLKHAGAISVPARTYPLPQHTPQPTPIPKSPQLHAEDERKAPLDLGPSLALLDLTQPGTTTAWTTLLRLLNRTAKSIRVDQQSLGEVLRMSYADHIQDEFQDIPDFLRTDNTTPFIKPDPSATGVIVEVGGTDYSLPTVEAICAMVTCNGTYLIEALKVLFTDLDKCYRAEATNLLLCHVGTVICLRINDCGHQFLVLRSQLEKLSYPAQMTRKRKQLPDAAEEPRNKRIIASDGKIVKAEPV